MVSALHGLEKRQSLGQEVAGGSSAHVCENDGLLRGRHAALRQHVRQRKVPALHGDEGWQFFCTILQSSIVDQ